MPRDLLGTTSTYFVSSGTWNLNSVSQPQSRTFADNRCKFLQVRCSSCRL